MIQEALKRRGWQLLLIASVQWGCASQQPLGGIAPVVSGPEGSVEAPRSARGNPPFYEVLGRRYYVMSSSAGYREQGMASWYGKEFHGLATSGGEVYDMHALTAAHKTLPIPTWVEVTNLENGKSVIVKVNDRGPFVADRIIDLSYRAAQTLDMIGAGTARVEVRALGEPSVRAQVAGEPVMSQPAFAVLSEAPGNTDAFGQRMFVQVGAFAERANAAYLIERLKAAGYANAFMLSEEGARALHRVRIGPLADVAEYDRMVAGLRVIGLSDMRLVTAQ